MSDETKSCVCGHFEVCHYDSKKGRTGCAFCNCRKFRVNTASSSNDVLRDRITELEGNVALLQRANMTYAISVCPELDGAISELQAERDALQARIQALEALNTDLKEALKSDNQQLDDYNEIQEVIMGRFEYRDGDLSEAEIVKDLFARIDRMAEEGGDFVERIQALEAENATLTAYSAYLLAGGELPQWKWENMRRQGLV